MIQEVLFFIGQYILVFVCGYLIVRGFIATLQDAKDRKLIVLKNREEIYKTKKNILKEKAEYYELRNKYCELYEEDIDEEIDTLEEQEEVEILSYEEAMKKKEEGEK